MKAKRSVKNEEKMEKKNNSLNKVDQEYTYKANPVIGLLNKSSAMGKQKNSIDASPSPVDVSKPGLLENVQPLELKFQIDPMASVLFIMALASRLYRLTEPRAIVFDELHYGKYVSLYLKNIFFFDSHPPLGKLLVAGAAYLANFDGQFKFDKIGSLYEEDVPLFALRLVPAVCGSLLVPACYHFMLELGLHQWTAAVAGFLILCDNALLTQSRFILMESMLLLFSVSGLVCALKFSNHKKDHELFSLRRWLWLGLSAVCLTSALCVKYVGLISWLLGIWIVFRDSWQYLSNRNLSSKFLTVYLTLQAAMFAAVSIAVYLSVFSIHMQLLYKAGPHDSVMTSAFQASLEGGLASITRGQPLVVAHGSQVTLRHTHGRACWLHSHAHVYPVRYADKRGSSHQQQVTCYSFKDVNNWWILKRPLRNDLVVSQPVDSIKHGDVIQLVHGITSRALNSHDVAAAVSPQNQEVSCYIDYNVSMPAQNLWRVEIVNKEEVGDVWHTIQSQVRLIHVNSSQALKFTGRQLPDWGFHQHEVATDRVINQLDTVWNVEEHRYTKSDDSREREMELVNAEMIPVSATPLNFWPRFWELQFKMLFANQDQIQSHMYASDPVEWPVMTRTIAYWVSNNSNAQVHLLGNVVIWWSALAGVFLYCTLVIFYLLRRRRQCFDIAPEEWERFVTLGEILLFGYLFHYLPYFFMDRTLFLHHYLPALIFKILLFAGLMQHIIYITEIQFGLKRLSAILKLGIILWCVLVIWAFRRLSVLSYGTAPLTAGDLFRLRWRETWDFIVQRDSMFRFYTGRED